MTNGHFKFQNVCNSSENLIGICLSWLLSKSTMLSFEVSWLDSKNRSPSRKELRKQSWQSPTDLKQFLVIYYLLDNLSLIPQLHKKPFPHPDVSLQALAQRQMELFPLGTFLKSYLQYISYPGIIWGRKPLKLKQ